MSDGGRRPVVDGPVLYVIGCATPVITDLSGLVSAATGMGWRVCIVLTPSAVPFVDLPALRALTDFPIRWMYKQPDDPDVLPSPDALVVAPASFNTVNKMANGASDTLALGLLNEYLATQTPVLVAPALNRNLARHPAYARSVTQLIEVGVRFVSSDARRPDTRPAFSKRDGDAAPPFPWGEVEHALAAVLRGLLGR